MKTKTYDFWQALDLFIITKKPIPLDLDVFYIPDCKNKELHRMYYNDIISITDTIKVPIPEGHNPDGLTLAHLQMGEDGEEYRLTEKNEPLPDDAEYWHNQFYEWVKLENYPRSHFTIRTRKPKGWFLSEEDTTHEQSSEVQPDLAQEFEELLKTIGRRDFSAHQLILIKNLHQRLKRLEKGTE